MSEAGYKTDNFIIAFWILHNVSIQVPYKMLINLFTAFKVFPNFHHLLAMKLFFKVDPTFKSDNEIFKKIGITLFGITLVVRAPSFLMCGGLEMIFVYGSGD